MLEKGTLKVSAPHDLQLSFGNDSPTVISSKSLGVKDMTVTRKMLEGLIDGANLSVEVLPDWNTEFTGIFYSVNSIPQIKKVVYDIPNGTTIVFFVDDTKEIARVMDEDTFDKETGVLQCIVKKMYGSRSRFLKDVVNKGVVIEKKEKKKKYKEVVDTYLDRFLRGEICVKCNRNEKKRLMISLDNTEARWSYQTMPTHFDNRYFIESECAYIGIAKDYEYKLLEWDENAEPFLEEGYEVVDYQDFVKSI